ncbi:MAG: efflux RND transporter periplasmic adaptor subunit, partial [Planctomycetes bacterium]|nr:efflux RND transporter periplasmic adaptor subunit [Planctomycetota bacterium]
VGAVGLLALLVLAYFVWQTRQPAKAKATSQASYQTTQVRRGNLALSASGTGKLQPVQQVDLHFAVPGTLAELNVQVGDQVTAGKVLAMLDGIDALKVDISSKQVALETAKKALNDLSTNASTNLPQALIDLSNAQAALDTAKQNLHQKGDPRCEDSVTRAYELDYYFAMYDVNWWQSQLENPKTKYGLAFIQDHISQYKPRAINDYVNWKYCEGYTDQEILDSQANLQLAEANVQHAQAAYQKMQTNGGLDPTNVAVAQATVKAAELQLQAAQKNLDGATLVAPIDGVATAVNGNKGELAGTSTFITLADLAHPQIDTKFDETDLQNVAAGCAASVSFDVLPNRTFAGTVTRILPALTTSGNVNAVEGYVELKDMTALTGKTLPVGTNASVDVTCNQAQNALLIPVEALHTTADGQSYVYVLNQVGTPEKRSVEVGLKTATTVEIRSGLQNGELVITSAVNLQ